MKYVLQFIINLLIKNNKENHVYYYLIKNLFLEFGGFLIRNKKFANLKFKLKYDLNNVKRKFSYKK